jgi:hypothetical protein
VSTVDCGKHYATNRASKHRDGPAMHQEWAAFLRERGRLRTPLTRQSVSNMHACVVKSPVRITKFLTLRGADSWGL